MVKLIEYKTDDGKSIEIHQLLAGREFARKSDDKQTQSIFNSAKSSANFCYCILVDNEACLVDPSWDVDGIFQYCRNDLNIPNISTTIYTHWHPDHVGGFMPTTVGGRLKISGLPEVLENGCSTIYFGADELEKIKQMHKLSDKDVEPFHLLKDNDQVMLNGINLDIISTPGHTVGSLCIYLSKANNNPKSIPMLITGDTLFIGSCGRFDQNREGMKIFHSINRLSYLPDLTMVLPGHNYAGSNSKLGQEKLYNSAIMQGKQLMDRLNEIYGEATPPATLTRANTNSSSSSKNDFDNMIQLIPIKNYTERALQIYNDMLKEEKSCKVANANSTMYFANGFNYKCASCFPVIHVIGGDSKV